MIRTDLKKFTQKILFMLCLFHGINTSEFYNNIGRCLIYKVMYHQQITLGSHLQGNRGITMINKNNFSKRFFVIICKYYLVSSLIVKILFRQNFSYEGEWTAIHNIMIWTLKVLLCSSEATLYTLLSFRLSVCMSVSI